MNPVARLMTTNGDAIVVVIPVPTVAAVPEDVVILVLIPNRHLRLPATPVVAAVLVEAAEVQGAEALIRGSGMSAQSVAAFVPQAVPVTIGSTK